MPVLWLVDKRVASPRIELQVKDFACGKGAKFFLGAKVDVNGPKGAF